MTEQTLNTELRTAMSTSLTSVFAPRTPPVPVTIMYHGNATICYVLPTSTGLQLKSLVLREVTGVGSFSDYLLTCNDVPFGSKTVISSHVDFQEGVTLVLEDRGDRERRT